MRLTLGCGYQVDVQTFDERAGIYCPTCKRARPIMRDTLSAGEHAYSVPRRVGHCRHVRRYYGMGNLPAKLSRAGCAVAIAVTYRSVADGGAVDAQPYDLASTKWTSFQDGIPHLRRRLPATSRASQ